MHGYIAAEGGAVGQLERCREADVGGAYHVVGEHTVLVAVGSVGHNENVVARIDKQCVRLDGLLNQYEYKPGFP